MEENRGRTYLNHANKSKDLLDQTPKTNTTFKIEMAPKLKTAVLHKCVLSDLSFMTQK